MKKLFLIMMALVLAATPVFANNWSVGLAGGYPQSSLFGQFEFDIPVKVELGVGIDYNYGKAVGLGAQLYGTYGFKMNDTLTLDLGVGATSRLTNGFYIAPAGRIGANFHFYDCAIVPFVRGDFGYAFGDAANKFFWEVTGGATYTF